MIINVTARHFKAQESLVEYVESAVRKLSRYYNGIIKCEVVLSLEKPHVSGKIAELNVSVYNAILTGIERTDDFLKSIDGAVGKVLVQLKKYKDKLRSKNRKQVRAVKAKV